MAGEKVLVVEDESIVSIDIQRRLAALDYQVVGHAMTGMSAVSEAGKLSPDIILMDIHLRGQMDGITAAQLIRERYDIPVIFLTAYADQETLERAKVTEAFGYILKPFQERELYSAIEMAVHKHRMDKRVRESEKWLDTTLKSIVDCVIVTDGNGSVRFINPAAALVLELSEKDAKGEKLEEVFKIDSPEAEEEDQHESMLVVRKRKIPIEVQRSPIRDTYGEYFGTVIVFRDISERRAREQTLKKAKEEALSALNEKSKFISIMSHELRTPLNRIFGMTELLKDISSDSERKEYLEVLKKSAGSLLSIVNDIIDYSVLTGGERTVFDEELSLVDFLETESSPFAEKCFAKGLDFYLSIDPALPETVHIDKNLFLKIIENLLSNAVKFTDRGEVSVSCAQEDDHILLAVADTGRGIPQDMIERIFDPFVQIDNLYTRLHGGTGLGLSVAKQAAIALSGTIVVESKDGEGSVFTCSIPSSQSSEYPAGRRVSPISGEIFIAMENKREMAEIVRYLSSHGLRVIEGDDTSLLFSEWKERLRKIGISAKIPFITDKDVWSEMSASGSLHSPIIVIERKGRRRKTVQGVTWIERPFRRRQLLSLVSSVAGAEEGIMPESPSSLQGGTVYSLSHSIPPLNESLTGEMRQEIEKRLAKLIIASYDAIKKGDISFLEEQAVQLKDMTSNSGLAPLSRNLFRFVLSVRSGDMQRMGSVLSDIKNDYTELSSWEESV